MSGEIRQWVPRLHRGDAIGDSCLSLNREFAKRHIRSSIWCLDADADIAAAAGRIADCPAAAENDVTLLHYALASPLNDRLKTCQGKRGLVYHNITPEHYFSDFCPHLVAISRVGRQQLAGLADCVDFSICDSIYNQRELSELGFRNLHEIPILIDYDKFKQPPDALWMRLLGDECDNILCVGRIAPNKKIEIAIEAFAYLRRRLNSPLRLLVVGKSTGMEPYTRALLRLTKALKLAPEDVWFTGHISEGQLIACYRQASAFFSASEHEGFCVPLVESMFFDLPILARSAAAVPDTLAESGLLFGPGLSSQGISCLMEEILNNNLLRQKSIDSQRRRFVDFEYQTTVGKWLSVIGKETGQ